jgi:hypothetical protein
MFFDLTPVVLRKKVGRGGGGIFGGFAGLFDGGFGKSVFFVW